VRTRAEIEAAEMEMIERIWYDRSRTSDDGETTAIEIVPEIMAKREEVEKRYGKDSLEPMSDFDWGMLNGKLSALRWVIGDEWDNLDT